MRAVFWHSCTFSGYRLTGYVDILLNLIVFLESIVR